MVTFILIRNDGMYLGPHRWTAFAKDARQFDAETIAPALREHPDCFAWRLEVEDDGYAPERTRRLPHFRSTRLEAA
jgi:hypothetical protein